jgi:endonuclease/exonuclease/phosphatase (EEP) superfamily protein YafD
MGSLLNRLVSWLFSAVATVILLILVYLGWYNYLLAGIFLVFGIILAFVSTALMHGKVNPSDSLEPPLTSRKRTAYSIMTLLASLLLFTWAILLLTGFIK